MYVSTDQLRAARSLLRLEQVELARRADVSVVTVRRIESPAGHSRVHQKTFERIRRALEKAGAEFIPDGVRRRAPQPTDADVNGRYERLREISFRSAHELTDAVLLTDADLYDEHGLPA